VFSRDNEVLEHPQVVWNDMVMTLADPECGAVRQPTPTVKVETQPGPSRPAPRLGEHDTEIRRAAAAPATRLVSVAATGDPASARTPLEGVTVLELGTYYAAPYGATLLADLGARVIKLEQLDGDPHRHMLPFPEVAGMKVLQGKESVAVDIGSDEGREIAYELVRRSDIVLQSFRAGVAERLKVDSSSLRRINPRLIYHSAPGYGVGGPCGHRPAFAPTIGAAAGLAWRNAGATIPERPDLSMDEIKSTAMRLALAVMGVGNSDGFAGVTVGSALLLGLLARQRGRPAPTMLTTMISSSMHALSDVMTRYPGQDPAPAADPDLLGFGPLYRLYETASGWIFLAAPTERDWIRLVSVIPQLGVDGRFASAPGRSANAGDLAAELGKWFLQKTAAQCEAAMRAADVACVEVAAGPVESHFLEKGSLGQECGFVTSAVQPMLDEAPRLAPLVQFSRSSTRVGGACLCGQHTDEVLAELGYDQNRISDLRAAGIIGG
jgi:crotonobetainyl-CoA:carnitine CoA-transferase CaiB-like acyl-CoA transferase